MLKIPLDDETVDFSYTKAVLEHMHPLEWVYGVRELWRVAREGIILALFNWDPDRPGAPILEKMANDDADRSRTAATRNPFNHKISLLDVKDVLLDLGATSWSRYMVGGHLTEKKNYKPYMVYKVDKR
jgi:hypothetical protein